MYRIHFMQLFIFHQQFFRNCELRNNRHITMSCMYELDFKTIGTLFRSVLNHVWNQNEIDTEIALCFDARILKQLEKIFTVHQQMGTHRSQF